MTATDDFGGSDDSAWMEIVDLVTSQPDWDEESADGPDDIVDYVKGALLWGVALEATRAQVERLQAIEEAAGGLLWAILDDEEGNDLGGYAHLTPQMRALGDALRPARAATPTPTEGP